jgi:hypothetical protein
VVVPGELVPLRGDAIRKSNASASLECNFVWCPQSRPGRRRKSLPNQDAVRLLGGLSILIRHRCFEEAGFPGRSHPAGGRGDQAVKGDEWTTFPPRRALRLI